MAVAIDAGIVEIKHTSTPWALRRYRTLEEWQQRAAQIRRHILVCSGLWLQSEKKPLKPRIFARIEREGYSIEKVFFESMPGFFVCGNLYRPLGKGPFPGIANPHGHWQRGRIEDIELGSIPGRCINFARQGMVAFAYDMVGYNDSDQVAHQTFGGRREDLWGIGGLSLQLWNSIRVVDFLEQLPDVDAKRIGCTGASGGGSQTFLLAAVDERIKAAAVVNMVSAQMQGGCNCENQGHLRLDINNVEIASCMAPKPQLLVSCTGDWTVNTPEIEYPAVRDIYGLYGAQAQITQVQVDAEHNYNKLSREAVYGFFNRQFLGGRGRVAERPYIVEKDKDLLVFSDRDKPANALDAEGVTEAVVNRSERRFAGLLKNGGRHFQQEMRPALASLLGVDVDVALVTRSVRYHRGKDHVGEELLLAREGRGEILRGMFYLPPGAKGKLPAVLVADDGGGQKLIDWASGKVGKMVLGLLQANRAVLVVGPFLSNAAQRAGHDETKSSHYHTYNQATMACRVQDILTALAYLDEHPRVGKRALVGMGQAGLCSLFARALVCDVERTAIDWARLDLNDDGHWTGERFVPGIRALGDVRTALALCAPGHLLVHATGRHFPERLARKAYRSVGRSAQLQVASVRMGQTEIVERIIGG